MNDNKKIAVNSIVIFLRLCIVSLVSIIASRVVLDALGASDFGLYNVVGGIVTLLNVINTAMLSTTYRYLAFEIGKKSDGNPNKIFNTSLSIHAFLALLIFILGLFVGDWYINNYLNVLPDKLPDALFVFHVSIFTAFLSTLFVPFQGLQIAYEKFAINASIDIVSQSIKLGAILLLIYSDTNRLRLYSIIMLSYSILSGVLYALYCYSHYWSVVKLKIYRDFQLISDMLQYALWTMFGALASVGKSQGSAVIINFFFGTVVNAAFAVAAQIESFVLVFARSLNSAAVPQITKNFSGGNSSRSIKLTSYISKYTFILMCFVAFPVLLEMDFLLGLWLKEVPDGSATFCSLMILGALLGCLGEGIPALVNATGNIKVYQIITHTFTLLGLPIAFICIKLGANPYSILVVFCVISFLLAFIRLYLLKRIFEFDVRLFINVSFVRIAMLSIPLVVFYLLYDSSDFTAWGHIAGMVVAELYLIVMILLLGLDSEEKAIIRGFLRRK
ncbi:oligosaccharide flippase family protein [uncultured Bacteroides sp.]|uniref:lipopolysaccharide biosynthesis protein n=1 Tax=uncultured Bacteroides sp. TaxID=162156 RepID=UPI002AAC1212|nr:oligosaccharide flippase family protein [uncultured Bacteroides sp.]